MILVGVIVLEDIIRKVLLAVLLDTHKNISYSYDLVDLLDSFFIFLKRVLWSIIGSIIGHPYFYLTYPFPPYIILLPN